MNPNNPVERIYAAGTGAMTATLDNAAAVKADNFITTIPATAHGFKAGSIVYISGTTNYNGMREIVAVATNTFNIKAKYIAETFAGSETAKVALYPNAPFRLLEYRLTFSTAATQDTFTITLDSGLGAYWDCQMESEAAAGNTYIANLTANINGYFHGDGLVCAFTNTDALTWGLELIYQKL